MKERDAIERFSKVMNKGMTGSWEHVRKIFEEAAGGPIPWEPDEPELPGRICLPDWGNMLAVEIPEEGRLHPRGKYRELTLKEKREAAARYNAVERVLAGLENLTEGEAAKGRLDRRVREDRITLSVLRLVLNEEREKLR